MALPVIYSMHFQHIYKQINSNQSIFYGWFSAMHTRVDIALCGLDEQHALELTEKIYAEINRVELMADRFNPRSEISMINRLATVEPFPVSDEWFAMIEQCINYNRISAGLFDVTVNSLNNHKDGINEIELDPELKTVYFKHPVVQIDLNGYIKGYALDKVKDILLENQCNDALVNMGNSSILALGNHPNGEGWKVNVPGKDNEYVILVNECLTSSGNKSDYRHIINPLTGIAIENLNVCSVITANATDGEVLATTSCIGAPELQNALCEHFNGIKL
ncbi:MAG: FAD:protein FMN transferase [Paludibacter sp.]|nr:FAD:protein FMN transferase [Paludibacter sp.]